MKEAVCRKSASDFEPDGRLEHPSWRRSHSVDFDTDWLGTGQFPYLTTSVASLWTPGYLYFGFRCPYASLNLFEQLPPQRIRDLYERDVAEVFLGDSPRTSHYKEFEVSPNGHWLDLEIDWERGGPQWDFNSGNQVATHVDEARRVWSAELKIPTSCLLIQPAVGQIWPVNFYRVEGCDLRVYLAWNATRTPQPNYHVPERFGRLHFVD